MEKSRTLLAIDGGKPVWAESWPPLHPVDDAEAQRVAAVICSETWSRGPMTRAFETEFAQFCGAKHCLLVASGTAALKLALLAAGIGPGDDVMLPGITWPSVAAAVFECGARPILADIDLETFAMSRATVEAALTPQTKAIVPTHLFSSQADVTPIVELATDRKVALIEDCAHSPGGRRFGRALGTFGEAGIFSFNQKKLLACGEGGCLITNSTAIFEEALALRDFESRPRRLVPGTHLASEFQAAILIDQLRKLPARLSLLEERAERLRDLLREITDVVPLVRLPDTDRQTFYNFCFRVERVPDIRWFRRALAGELNLPMSGAYEPLSETPTLAVTRSDPRFRSLGEGLNTDLPNCKIAHYQQAVRFRYNALMANERAIDIIARGVEKVREWV